MIEIQHEDRVGESNTPPRSHPSDRPATAPGCMCKKELYFLLRPNAKYYHSRTIQDFFTDELLTRCGIDRDEMKRIRVFPVRVNAVVVSYLKTNNLL